MTEPVAEELQRRLDSWSRLPSGAALTLVKVAPDGSEAARYDGTVVALLEPEMWMVIRAVWTYQKVNLNGLPFCPGDVLLEWFSPIQPFNAFAVYSPEGQFRGWYANVSLPAYLQSPGKVGEPPLLIWHDLYLDLVGLPNGEFTIRDEDELFDSRLEEHDPALHGRILVAAMELERRFRGGHFPFVDPQASFARLTLGDGPADSAVINESRTGPDFVHPH